jgi:hypothetical protein
LAVGPLAQREMVARYGGIRELQGLPGASAHRHRLGRKWQAPTLVWARRDDQANGAHAVRLSPGTLACELRRAARKRG